VLGGKQALVGFSAPGGLTTKSRLLEIENISPLQPCLALEFADAAETLADHAATGQVNQPALGFTDHAALGFANNGTHD
jgi:hypothetical protein